MKRIRIQNLEWEFAGGLSYSSNNITALPEDQSYNNFQSSAFRGFQLGAFPLFRISRPLAIRSGLMFLKREYHFRQNVPWEADYAEKSHMLGIPVHAQYSFGYSDQRLNVYSGLQLNYLIRNSLTYSALAIPGYRQEGTIKNSFDRKRFLAEFQMGVGLRFQVSKVFIGVDVSYYLDLWDHSRFSPPRTLQIYQDQEPPVAYYSPRYLGRGVMINLVFQKRRI
ncbi:porin family protein [Bacteroidota bacterium]